MTIQQTLVITASISRSKRDCIYTITLYIIGLADINSVGFSLGVETNNGRKIEITQMTIYIDQLYSQKTSLYRI